MRTALALILLTIGLASAAHTRADPPLPIPKRVAVVVGSNHAALDREPLRYAEDDARAVAAVLTEHGGFVARDVAVLLDPEPGAVLAALDAAFTEADAGDALVLFYYAGHADESALYPHGQPLSYAALRTRLSVSRAGLWLGILDAYRGDDAGEDTQVEPSLPPLVDSERSIVIVAGSSRGQAHASEPLGGALFTSHWNAALRGAGDRNGDGQVTLGEAFDYAKALTIRDGARLASGPVPPSFALNVRGRQDLVLTTPGAPSTVRQRESPLPLVQQPVLPRPLLRSTLPSGMQAVTAWIGRDHTGRRGFQGVGSGLASGVMFPRGLTDRWQWLIPTLAFTYRAGEHGAHEWLPSAGIVSWGAGYSSLEGALVELDLGASLEYRQWFGPRTALTVGGAAMSHLRWHSDEVVLNTPEGPARTLPKWVAPNTWNAVLSVGISHTLANRVTLHLSGALRRNVLFDGDFVALGPRTQRGALEIGLGAVQSLGLRPQHLVQVHLTDHVALNADAAVHYRIPDRSWHETYLGGATFVW